MLVYTKNTKIVFCNHKARSHYFFIVLVDDMYFIFIFHPFADIRVLTFLAWTVMSEFMS